MKNWQVINGNNIDILKTYADNTFDSIVTDPPYGISFLGKDWDSKKATETTSKQVALQNLPSGMKHTSLADDLEFQYWMRDVFLECNRVLKPGGYLLAFSAARTYHHMAMAAQTAGLEVRDQLMWLYGSGFPKAQDIGKAIDKRAGAERKIVGVSKNDRPKSQVKNGMGFDRMLDHGQEHQPIYETEPATPEAKQWSGWKTALKPAHEPIVMARKPFKGSCIDNVLEWGTGALNIDASRVGDEEITNTGRFPSNVLGEVAEEYQKYFYCPKVSRKERHAGFETKNIPAPFGDVKGAYVDGERMAKVADDSQYAASGNNHPTVKPVELMKYLIKLVTPKGGRVLDPFNGSGSTGMAAVELGYDYVGCELDPNYVEIANNRISAWEKKFDTPANNLFDNN